MTNYYYWFACFAYCDDAQISNKKCCPDILKEWEIVFHKEYYMDLLEFIIGLFETSVSVIYDMIFKKLTKLYKNILINKFIYYYNFVILKSDKHKKIICAFPGTTNILQLIIEIACSNLISVPNKNNKDFKVSKMFYNTFEEIKDDFVKNLLKISGANKSDYQTIFVGHSLGGALASLASFYTINQNIIKSEPILITFGQPRVGNEPFAMYLTENIQQIYRFARLNDIVTLNPLINQEKMNLGISILLEDNKILKYAKIIKFLFEIFDLNNKIFKSNNLYSHIGGLFMIDDYKKKIYHCKDFYNQNT